MSDIGNKKIMSKNIKYYMEINNKDRAEICRDLGFAYTTFTDWYNGKKYPRIDKIEQMAKYFNIQKSDLIEDHLSGNTETVITIRDPQTIDLITLFSKLNDTGKQKAIENVSDLASIPRYTIRSDGPVQEYRIAARNGNNTLRMTEQQKQEFIENVEKAKSKPIDDDLI